MHFVTRVASLLRTLQWHMSQAPTYLDALWISQQSISSLLLNMEQGTHAEHGYLHLKAIVVGSARAEGSGRFQGTLKVGSMPDGAPIELPVIIIRGAQDGPVLWLHGCVHGNEYCGTFSIHEFTRSLDPRQVKGAVIALPILNLTGFRARQRSSPFEIFNNTDMNRCFPGSPDGGMTEQMAHVVFAALQQNATHFVDFHTAYTSDTRWALYAHLGGEVSRVGRHPAR